MNVIDAAARFGGSVPSEGEALDRSKREALLADPAAWWAAVDPTGEQRAMWRAAGAVVVE